MAKEGRAKNTVNKAKHTKLMNQKKNRLRDEKIQHKLRLKAIMKKSQEQTNTDDKS